MSQMGKRRNNGLSNPQQVLNKARELYSQGRYGEALECHLWFHHNAIEHQPSLSAVRLSFALLAWAELASVFPPAKEALIEIRDQITQLLAVHPSFAMFQEVAALNEVLQEEAKTGIAFLALQHTHPQIARYCYDIAEKGLLSCQAVEVCSSYIPDSLARFTTIRSNRRLMLSYNPDEGEQEVAYRDVVETRYAEDAVRLINILLFNGRSADAEQIKELAIFETPSKNAREIISSASGKHTLDGRLEHFGG